MTLKRHHQSQSGFTLVELMIATMVFSVILLVITQGLIEIGRIYYRGTINNRAQEVTRSTVDNIAQTIELSGGLVNTTLDPPAGTTDVTGFCAGNRRYSFYLHQPVTNNVRRFVSDDISALGGCSLGTTTLSSAQMLTGGPGQELLADNMRLAKFLVSDSGNGLYDISIRVAYGTDDTLCSPTIGDCNNPGNTTSAQTEDDVVCKGFSATSSFCSVAEVNTTASKRLR